VVSNSAPDLARDDAGSDETIDPRDMMDNARDASAFLKALAHEGRLMILCHLSGGEKSVTELEILLDSRQAAVSQQLARLRMEGLVDNRRDGKAIFYRIKDPRVEQMVATIHDMFCKPK
jgi:DNA-binding transcriptional ArsR family regulator